MVDPAVNEELITCPDHRDVLIHSDQGIPNRRDFIVRSDQGIIDTFLASFGVGRDPAFLVPVGVFVVSTANSPPFE
jgi:hypothetical protein